MLISLKSNLILSVCVEMREGQRSSINEKCAGNAAHILIIMTSHYSALRRQHYLPQVIIGGATIVCSDSSGTVDDCPGSPWFSSTLFQNSDDTTK